MTPIDRHRLALLAELDADGRTGDLRALSEAFVVPLAFALGEQRGFAFYARFLAQVMFDPTFEVLAERRYPFTTGLRRVIALLHDAVPEMAPVIRSERIALAAGLVVHSLADRERTVQARPTHPDASFDLFAANLVDAMVGVLHVPASPATRHALATQQAFATQQAAAARPTPSPRCA